MSTATSADALRRSIGALSTLATSRMESDLGWFADLSAQDRSWVGQIVQAGIRGFVDWYDRLDDAGAEPGAGDVGSLPAGGGQHLAASIFGAAPRTLAGVITLQQTVDLIRLSIDVLEAGVDDLLDPADLVAVHSRMTRYAREVAFATATVYARAAEARGAWDARLEALVVDAVLRAEADEALLSRASALGWSSRGSVAVVIGAAPARRTETDLFGEVRRAAQGAGMDALCAVQGDRLVVLLGGVGEVGDERAASEVVLGQFSDGPVVVGSLAPDLASAHTSARSALAGWRAAPGWPEAPRPVASDDLVPERALGGDGHARRHLVEEVYQPLAHARGALLETLSAFFDSGSAVEGTARALFVHANTVRYRLRQVTDLTGLSPSAARDAFTLRLALTLGRLTEGRATREL